MTLMSGSSRCDARNTLGLPRERVAGGGVGVLLPTASRLFSELANAGTMRTRQGARICEVAPRIPAADLAEYLFRGGPLPYEWACTWATWLTRRWPAERQGSRRARDPGSRAEPHIRAVVTTAACCWGRSTTVEHLTAVPLATAAAPRPRGSITARASRSSRSGSQDRAGDGRARRARASAGRGRPDGSEGVAETG
jgi:hypothetical protein